MASAIDPAIIEALSLQDASPMMRSHGGSGFSSTFKITAMIDGHEKLFFVKQGDPDSKAMFAGRKFSSFSIAFLASKLVLRL
jgi:protein-ribulosamine 3-kinase